MLDLCIIMHLIILHNCRVCWTSTSCVLEMNHRWQLWCIHLLAITNRSSIGVIRKSLFQVCSCVSNLPVCSYFNLLSTMMCMVNKILFIPVADTVVCIIN